MKYLKIKITYTDFPERLNRVLCVNPQIKLFNLGIYIQILIKSAFEHMFLFKSSKCSYVDETWIQDSITKSYDYKVVDLFSAIVDDNKIEFIYDNGEDYIFDINSKGYIEMPFNRDVILLDGKGDGIFEDNRSGLNSFLSNETPKEKIVAWNLNIKNISKYDYDKKLDVDAINEKLIKEYNKTLKLLHLDTR